jgi:hypothetical protein
MRPLSGGFGPVAHPLAQIFNSSPDKAAVLNCVRNLTNMGRFCLFSGFVPLGD